MSDRPSWAEVFGDLIDARMEQVHTAMPGSVIGYNPVTQRADVAPQIRAGGASLPVIQGVPVVWPLVYGALNPGDGVLLIFCETAIDAWRARGEQTDAGDISRHGLHGAVAIAGLRPENQALPYVPGSTVVPGTDVRLGGYMAAESVIRGTTFCNNFNLLLDAFKTWLSAVGSAVPPLAPANATLLGVIEEFKIAMAAAQSLVVKVP